ncbi:LOW QUALITY PROTEIN: 2-aminoethanethiol dioxygenase-like [Sphaeramia orbicularis]|uniref:LOW QUALITY PROTEIN: 2-aminoethanethiol dioxygenase-like n=1 Tax=Sphaeramia orbicularis TaxID=375764 RepID=UPI0011808627|nr:LOW QUALITY PROTEIN: 2-aminoethanethiol dioxygenase-like [Sphaeramia orbicularis]
MRPGDRTMSSLVQRIARQALVTFRSPEPGKSFVENHGKLKSLMTEVRAADLKLVPRRADDSPAGSPPPHRHRGAPPVTYMHICETDHFSMGVFLLKSGASIPLHDHPGMHGVLKVLYGTVRISCFDRPDPPPAAPPSAHPGALRRSVLRSTGEYTEDSGPCVLSPDRDNLHQIDAVDGPTAFMDILAPPYDPDDGRDCHYYRVLTEAEAEPDRTERTDQEVWLMEISQPAEFWCGGEPYPGPEVCL